MIHPMIHTFVYALRYIAPIGVSWSAINYHDLTVRAVGVAVVNMMGNLGSVGASYLYTIPGDPNHGNNSILFHIIAYQYIYIHFSIWK